MSVPRLIVLTDRHAAARAGRSLADTIALAAEAGAPAVLLREKDLDRDARHRLAAELRPILGEAHLLVAGDPALADQLDADGVHLAAADPVPGAAPLSWALLSWGRSCHDRAEVVRARAEGLDYVTVSPLGPTGSKPGYGPVLGVDGVAELVDAADGMPVLALGGVGPEHVTSLLEAGVHGVAVMGGVMGAADPAAAVAALLARLPTSPTTPDHATETSS